MSSEPVEGVTLVPDLDRFPRAMIEGCTEFQWAELPPELRDALRVWCAAFRVWMEASAAQ